MNREAPVLRHLGMVALVALSLPLGLALEGAVLPRFVSHDLLSLRALVGPMLPPFLWGLAVLTVPLAAVGLWVQRRMVRRGLARVGVYQGDPARRQSVTMPALFVATSLPQIPGLLAAVASLAGAVGRSVSVVVGLSTVGVLCIGLDGLRGVRPSPYED